MAASVSVMIVINWFFKESVFWPWYTLIGTLVTFSVALCLSSLFASDTGKDPATEKPEAPG
jgi:hypothetical protein